MIGKLFVVVAVAVTAFLLSKYQDKKLLGMHKWRLTHEYLPSLGEFIGIDSKYNISRKLIEMQFLGQHPGNKYTKVSERSFAGVRSLLYQPLNPPTAGESRPGIIFFHSGGWIEGVPESSHSILLELVRLLEVTVVAFDYRKAPKHVFPAGYNDCLRGLIAFGEAARSLGVSPFRLAVMGDGSGGNLAAAVVGKLRQIKELKMSVKLLVLFNPMLQALDFNLPSHAANADQFVLRRESLLDYWLLYIVGKTSVELRAHLLANNHTNSKARKLARELLWNRLRKGNSPSRAGKDREKYDYDARVSSLLRDAVSDPRASPFLLSPAATAKLPPVYLVTCERDVLRDEGLAWRHRLLEAGARVTHRHYNFHSSLLTFYASGHTESLTALNDLTSFLLMNAVL